MDETEAIASLAALAQHMRLRVFRALVVAGATGSRPGQLSEALAVPAATLSFHLKELTHAELVTQERDGRSLIYRANFERMNGLLGYLTEHCCEGDACDVQPATCSPRLRASAKKKPVRRS